MKARSLDSLTPLILTASLSLILIIAFEWVDSIFWPETTHRQHHLHFSIFVTSICCIAAFFITRYLRTRAVLASIVQYSEDGIVGQDLEGRIISWNFGAEHILGYTFEEVKGKPISMLLPEGWVDDTPKTSADSPTDSRATHFQTIRVRKNGTPIHVSLSVSPIRNATGASIGTSTIVRDITDIIHMKKELENAKVSLEQEVKRQTLELIQANEKLQEEIQERRRSEEELTRGEKKYRLLSQEFHTLLNAISDTLVLLSHNMEILWTNNGRAYHRDAPLTELTGKCCHDLFYNRSTPCDDCPVVKSFLTGEEASQVAYNNGRFLDKRAFPIKDGDKVSRVIILVSDITEKMRIQAETMHASHLASLGELAAGVAHEINNPINGIINYAQILVNEYDNHSLGYDIGKRMVREGERVAEIVKTLLSFARGGIEDKWPTRVDTILKETLILSQAQIRKENIRLEIKVPDDLPEIEANSQRIVQAFLNIINNARYALNEKYPVRADNKIIGIHGEKVTFDGLEHVRVTFWDKGVGIPSDKLDMLTKPFFSTKPFGKGTGLGLSITQKIVEDHGGRLRFESIEGEFTKVMIELPSRNQGIIDAT